jgi:hypothetical protein
MKPAHKTVAVLMALLMPYMAAAVYVSQHIENGRFPMTILRGMLIYLVCAIALFVYLRKKILTAAPPSPPSEKKSQLLKSARSLKLLGWILLLNDIYQATRWDYAHESAAEMIALFSWGFFLVFGCFWYARKISLQAQAISDTGEANAAGVAPLG